MYLYTLSILSLNVVFEKVLLFSIIAASFDILAGSLFFFLIPFTKHTIATTIIAVK